MDFTEDKQKMQGAVDHFKGEIAAIRTGRAVPALVENIICPAYGGTQRLSVKELGTITAADPQTLVIAPWDPSISGDIRKGILEANVGLNPVLDSAIIRVTVPALTTERRVEYVKLLHQKMEEAKISIRNIREDKRRTIKEAFEVKSLSEDEKFRAEDEYQKIVDDCQTQIEELGKKKEAEILGVG